MLHPEEVLSVRGVPMCVQEFGARSDPGLLLIGGSASSMDWWEDEFCERLAAGGRRVVRYDLRDTGRSVASQPGAPDYTGQDLVEDAAALLTVLGMAPAHLVGLSMGGGIAQSLAAGRPELVAALTLMSTSPIGPAAELPPPAPELLGFFSDPPAEPDWGDRAAVIDHLLAVLAVYAGEYGVDEERMRPLLGRIHDRTVSMAASQTNHDLLEGAPAGDITAPTLVMHGTADPLLPIAHGEALAGKIPGATLLRLPGVGHEYPPRPVWDMVIEALLRHTHRQSSAR